MVMLFDIGHQVGVAGDVDDQDLLPWVLLGFRVRHDVEQASCFNGHGDLLERDAAFLAKHLILLRRPPEWLHRCMVSAACAECAQESE